MARAQVEAAVDQPGAGGDALDGQGDGALGKVDAGENREQRRRSGLVHGVGAGGVVGLRQRPHPANEHVVAVHRLGLGDPQPDRGGPVLAGEQRDEVGVADAAQRADGEVVAAAAEALHLKALGVADDELVHRPRRAGGVVEPDHRGHPGGDQHDRRFLAGLERRHPGGDPGLRLGPLEHGAALRLVDAAVARDHLRSHRKHLFDGVVEGLDHLGGEFAPGCELIRDLGFGGAGAPADLGVAQGDAVPGGGGTRRSDGCDRREGGASNGCDVHVGFS